MARAGLGQDRSHMASHEPTALSNYIKFRKPRNRRGGYSLMEEERERKSRV